ncbi:MAG: cytochrome C, partial [Candidatus Omnitrophica bacterium]|nr:cytochrome C [Candidatus Omnitrophota bacterium]
VASDEKRQTIPWVKAIHPDGKEEVFVDKESEFTVEKPPAGEMRRMDCIDCHNRPSHVFKSPDATVNEAMAYGAIDRELPFIKRESVKALLGKYDSKDSAREGIRTYLENFYQKKYPQVASERKEKISKAAEALATIYEQNSFPKMNVSWKVYPNNIGHWISPGCFRCHDGKHESPSGKIISNDCKVCHNIIAQGPPSVMESSVDGLEFKHPQDIQDAWKEMACYECHTGGSN